jgi:tripartite-type tricarboxylate transporter receptor subunit TctC
MASTFNNGRRRFVSAGLGLGALSLGGYGLAAENYPSRVIKLVVPFPPGGATDIVSRRMEQRLGNLTGQPWIVDNKAGAGGRMGVDAVAKSAPDGYTLVHGTIASLTIAPQIEKSPYDPLSDLTPISRIFSAVAVLVVKKDLPVHDVSQLVAYLKQNGRKATFGSSGVNGLFHIGGELFKTMTGVDMTHVGYRGDAPAIMDLVAGNIDLMFVTYSVAIPHVKSGAIRVLGISSSERSTLLPGVKTVAEQGLPGFATDNWGGLLGPAGLPRNVVNTLSAAMLKAGQNSDLPEFLASLGATWSPSTPEQFSAQIRADYDKWGKVIREKGLKSTA